MKQAILRLSVTCVALIFILGGLVGCGQRETPEERLERLRLNHELRPLGFTTIQTKADPSVVAVAGDHPAGTDEADSSKVAAGEPSDEAEQEPGTAPDTMPVGLIDLTLANQGAEHLPMLTVLVTISDPEGGIKLRERKTLDLGNLRPGVATQMPVSLPGVEIAETDEVHVELEANLSPEELRALPEFAALQES